jgi:hypothetical protein
VPSAAIAKQNDVSRVFVVVQKRIAERIVQVGSEKDGMTSILAGLKVGESVVVSPGADVRDGALVQ